jgi:hypothetical protein
MKKSFKFLSIFFTAIAALCFYWNHSQTNKAESSQEDTQKRYDYLMSHVVKENVHPLLRPIRLSVGELASACGTLVLRSDMKPGYIVTANHIFPETQPGSDYYDYHVYGPKGFTDHGHISSVVLDSFRGDDTPEGINDVAICNIGDPSLISRVSKVRVSAENPIQGEFHVLKMDHVAVVSITTGEKFYLVAEAVNVHKANFFVMLYESVNGESGSGFWDEGGGRLYILSGNIVVDSSLRETLSIPIGFKHVAMMSGTKISW